MSSTHATISFTTLFLFTGKKTETQEAWIIFLRPLSQLKYPQQTKTNGSQINENILLFLTEMSLIVQ